MLNIANYYRIYHVHFFHPEMKKRVRDVVMQKLFFVSEGNIQDKKILEGFKVCCWKRMETNGGGQKKLPTTKFWNE